MKLFVSEKKRRLSTLLRLTRQNLGGSHLHVRLVYTFCILAALPIVIMTIFSALFFHFGIQTWFSERVQTAVDESQAVAEAYLHEHQQTIRADILAMANDINLEATRLVGSPKNFERFLTQQSLVRNLSEAIIVNERGEIIAGSSFTISLIFETVPPYAIQKAKGGEISLLIGEEGDRVRALVKLSNFANSYLFVGRMMDPQVLSHVSDTREAAQDYANLQNQYSSLQFTITAILCVVGLIMLMSAFWMGLFLARKLVSPIKNLINVADRVRGGDLSARINEEKSIEELDYLARSFNRMTTQIQEQQNELLQANRQLDQRRHFTETVLSGVSSGVIGLDKEGRINIANISASELLECDEKELLGKKLSVIRPEFSQILQKAHESPKKITQDEIPVLGENNARRSFLVRIVIETIGNEERGTIVTFDDITELQSAQRKAAWADVARRIAHEMKNPLTPIQLSAERLKRKYLSQIKEDPETFEICTDTIIKHVGDIGHMVGEFSNFARMPEPKLLYENLEKQIQDVVIFLGQAHPNLSISFVSNEKNLPKILMDAQQIRQALTNLIQNSIDSVQSFQEQNANLKQAPQNSDVSQGKITVYLTQPDENHIAVLIKDNGIGLPKEVSHSSLTEPYVTHKPKGTGLGLAIVKKIMEDHDGELLLSEPKWFRDKMLIKASKAQGIQIQKPGSTDQVSKKAGLVEGNDKHSGACVMLLLPKKTEENTASEHRQRKAS